MASISPGAQLYFQTPWLAGRFLNDLDFISDQQSEMNRKWEISTKQPVYPTLGARPTIMHREPIGSETCIQGIGH